jgi:hypothetical protein
MSDPPPEMRAGMSQMEHLTVKTGMEFRLAGTTEIFFLAFSMTYTIFA